LWQPKVITVSALTGEGIASIWKMIEDYVAHTKSSGFFDQTRRNQNVHWMQEYFQSLLHTDLHQSSFESKQKELERQVATESLSPLTAAQRLLEFYHTVIRGNKS
jgi:LAO/AO transport system kinase